MTDHAREAAEKIYYTVFSKDDEWKDKIPVFESVIQATIDAACAELKQRRDELAEMLRRCAFLPGNHRRVMVEEQNVDKEQDLSGVGYAMLMLEPQIRELLTGDPYGELRCNMNYGVRGGEAKYETKDVIE